MIVSGAGPAGAMAAHRCARSGLRTVLVERNEVPRPKCCGGGVLERSLRQLDLPLPDAVFERDIFGASLVHQDTRAEYRSPSRVAVTVRRERFDEHLVRAAETAGAELLTGQGCERAKEEAGKVTVELRGGTRLEGRYLIIAEGANSRSARQVLGPYPRDGLAMGLAVECAFTSDPGDLLEFHLFEDDGFRMPFVTRGGMDGWMFPHRTGGNVGIGGIEARSEDLRRRLDALIVSLDKRFGGATPVGPVKAHPIPVKPRRRFSSDRCLVTGDAAGLASAMTGEGISYALRSGTLAADAVIATAGRKHRNGYLRTYDRAVRTEILPILRAARWASVGFQHLFEIIDLDTVMRNVQEDRTLIDACVAMSRAEKDWTYLLRRGLVRLPPHFFAALGQ